ncbi:hypothetical protein AV530_007581 [Patagioenas fasciata monilis]|uniref:Uncharacterized protein n=1 Tax=Patagioenas fasciata monilis TaxID=372326 RepID=A0A1V4JZZ0_PATFA|nr:hypothetical protein AV530_007581 [Patagioenas fasciata monilis]
MLCSACKRKQASRGSKQWRICCFQWKQDQGHNNPLAKLLLLSWLVPESSRRYHISVHMTRPGAAPASLPAPCISPGERDPDFIYNQLPINTSPDYRGAETADQENSANQPKLRGILC